MKRELTNEERVAFSMLVDTIKDIGLFEPDEDDPNWMHTTGRTLDLTSFTRHDWEVIINAVSYD